MPLSRRPVVIANEIRMKRSQHPGSFLVVEGRDDRLFCERYTDERCDLVVAEGKESVLEVIRILDDAGFVGVLGMVDPDFDLLEGAEPHGPNVVTCDAHDLEVALVCSPAFDRLLLEFGSPPKIRALGVEVRELVLSAAAPVGYLRWLSMRNDLRLKFQGLRLTSCIDRRSLSVDTVELCRCVMNLSIRTGLDETELSKAVEGLRDARHDMCHVCCGDDVLKVLSIGLRTALGTNDSRDVSVERLKQSLRLAFEDADFRNSALGTAILDWERRNPGYCVLKE